MVNNKFIIIVAVYNAIYNGRNHIKMCLDSIAGQTYKNYDVTVIDDHSTDGTWETILQFPFRAIRNAERNHHGFANQLFAMRFLRLNKEDIYVIVDGDDWLVDDHVLEYVNGMYQDGTLLTYGKYDSLSGNAMNVGEPLKHLASLRYIPWITSHLKTFKVKLFQALPERALMNKQGEYFKVVGDSALMYPMMELAGVKKVKCAERVLYIYNDLHGATDFIEVYKEESNMIRHKLRYHTLKWI